MTTPLLLLAAGAVLLGLIGTPAWPWLQAFLELRQPHLDFAQLAEAGLPQLMVVSSLLVFAGLGLGWWIYGRTPIHRAADPDALQKLQPTLFHALKQGFYLDELYAITFLRPAWWTARFCNGIDRWIWSAIPIVVASLTRGLGQIDFSVERWVVNKSFDAGCDTLAGGGRLLARLQNGRIQSYLRLAAAAVSVLILFLILRNAR